VIAKDFRGSGFRGALNYVLSPEHNPQIITKENVFGNTPQELAHEFGLVRALRQDVEKPVHHIALSFAHEDRHLSPQELEEIARRHMEGIGYGDAQWIAVEHRDRDHQHLHIIASRIQPDGTLIRYQYRDWERAMDVLRGIERDYGLRGVERDRERGSRNPRREEYRLAMEHGKASERLQLQSLVREAWADRPEFPTFVSRLEEMRIKVQLYRDTAGNITGISYGLDVRAFGGFSLGPSYTWKGIQREGVQYDVQRDRSLVERLASGERQTWAERQLIAQPTQDIDRIGLLIRAAATDQPTLGEFIHRLDYLGVRIQLNVATTGYVSGITYELEGKRFKGSDVGREFSWKGIQGLGVSYDAERDREAVRLAGRVLPEAVDAPAGDAGRIQDIERMRALICGAVVDRPTLTDFVSRLEAAGVQVRAYQGPDGGVFSLGYRLDGTYVRARELGAGYSWSELLRTHVRSTKADEAVVRRIGTLLEGKPKGSSARKGGASSRQVAELRGSVESARQGRPTLREFAQRLDEKGVGIQLYRDEGEIISVSFELRGKVVRARDLGTEHTWSALSAEGLRPDPQTDKATIQLLARDIHVAPRPGPTAAELEYVRGAVASAMVDQPGLTDFVARLDRAGIGVRLHTDPEGRPLGISYQVGDVSVKSGELGPGHSWRRLEREGLSVEKERDREVLGGIVQTLDRSSLGRDVKPPTPEQLAHVRLVVQGAVADRPTYTDFVSRVEGAGVEVRLYGNERVGPVSVSYGLGDVSVRGTDLGPGHSWHRLEREDLTLDTERDREALRRTLNLVDRPSPVRARKRPTPEQLADVRGRIDRAAQGRPTFTDFARRAEDQGVEVRLYREPSGQVFGVGYGYGGLSIKARELGDGYSWRDLQNRTTYHPVRDTRAVDVRSTTVERSHSIVNDLTRVYHAGREVGQWVRRPAEQILRLGGRLLSRVAVTAAREAAYALAQERARRNEELWQAQLAEWRKSQAPQRVLEGPVEGKNQHRLEREQDPPNRGRPQREASGRSLIQDAQPLRPTGGSPFVPERRTPTHSAGLAGRPGPNLGPTRESTITPREGPGPGPRPPEGLRTDRAGVPRSALPSQDRTPDGPGSWRGVADRPSASRKPLSATAKAERDVAEVAARALGMAQQFPIRGPALDAALARLRGAAQHVAMKAIRTPARLIRRSL
jgi:hypothetical protein